MKKEYSFKNGQRGKFHRPKKVQRTIRLDADVLAFCQELSAQEGIPYQTLINLILRKFAMEEGQIVISAPAKAKVS